MRFRVRQPLAGLIAAVALLLAAAAPAPARAAGPAAPAVGVPAGVTAGVAVYDRQASAFTVQHNADRQFRAASIVKLLIALDFFWDRGPGYAVPDADRARLTAMLRGSDDDAATYYWSRNGYEQVVNRMVARLELRDTAPPASAQRGYWGYTAVAAADVVRIYRYVLDTAPEPVRRFVMDNLRHSTRCAADTYDQHFGIPGVFARPWAVKQGWSGFGDAPKTCGGGTARVLAAASVDLVGEVLHTTGTVGPGDRSIVVVLTLHPDGTPFSVAYNNVTTVTRSLRVPGASPLSGASFGTWGAGVRVRSKPTTTDSTVLATVPAGVDVLVSCQKPGEEVVIDTYRNSLWAYLPQFGGYMTNIYVKTPGNRLPNVPDC